MASNIKIILIKEKKGVICVCVCVKICTSENINNMDECEFTKKCFLQCSDFVN